MNPALPIAPKEPAANPSMERRASPQGPTTAKSTASTTVRPALLVRPTPTAKIQPKIHRTRVFALLAVAIAVILGSAILRLPAARQSSARVAHAARHASPPTAPPVDPSSLEELRAGAKKAGDRLIRNRSEFRDWLTEIEGQALAQGWQIETQVQPSEPAPDGLPNLTTYAVTANLATHPNHSGPAFDGLILWLDGLARSTKAVEIRSILFIGDANGLTKARVDLRLMGRAEHEPHSAK